MGRTKKQTLIDDPRVKELLEILTENGKDTGVLTTVFDSVSAMERQLSAAVKSLEAVQRELSTMREERDHPLRTLLDKTARTLSAKIKGLRARIDVIKDGIINGCKNAVSAFRDRGISALNNLADFTDIKQTLLNERDGINECIAGARASVAKIEAAAEHYHSATRAIKNIGRAVRGKDPIPDIKPNGTLARLIETPLRSEISHLSLSLRFINKALASLDKLEKAAEKASERERPSARETMKRLKKQQDAERQDAPIKTKVKVQEEAI